MRTTPPSRLMAARLCSAHRAASTRFPRAAGLCAVSSHSATAWGRAWHGRLCRVGARQENALRTPSQHEGSSPAQLTGDVGRVVPVRVLLADPAVLAVDDQLALFLLG